MEKTLTLRAEVFFSIVHPKSEANDKKTIRMVPIRIICLHPEAEHSEEIRNGIIHIIPPSPEIRYLCPGLLCHIPPK